MAASMNKTATADALTATARQIRGRIVRMSHAAAAAHLGSALSCVDILVAAYWGALKIDPEKPDDPDRDRFIFSKGHASAALYATLAARGFFPPEWLATYGQNGSRLPEQMSPGCTPGVEAATGSLGHGLSLGLGMAVAARIQNRSYRVWVLMSDGECNEGSVWEAAMFASAQALDNVTVMIDYNGWQATGRSDEIMALHPLKEKWVSFGFAVHQVDGHDLTVLPKTLGESTRTLGRPSCIIAETVKGKGVSFMEDDNNWHYRVPSDEELRAALAELGQQ